ncbi:choline ABC transporter substrate-binding protein [Pseudomonas fluorescens]|uniref:choline ABC transporter substrate-binding protein n=1 Tax=Pseudomonas fluorescens TaxID=294 RepID=UPI0004D0E8E0|nr:choline ABC transporter substrate-binding protein [Pseudomonas fluorescens]AIG01653.1 glycine/betaine ABC transporter substrate-binding protein [Pseudomonas fluorescens]
MRKALFYLAFYGFTFTSLNAFAAGDPDQCKSIRLADLGWADNAANNGVTMALAESLGYAPSKTLVAVPIALGSIQAGKLDALLDYWSPSLDPTVMPLVNEGKLLKQQPPNMTGAKYTLAVPTYLADQGLHSFQDLAKFKDQLGGKIYGIEPGSGGNSSLKKMIEKNLYGLGSFTLVESSETAMRMEVSRAIARKRPIVFLGWAPHPMNLEFKMTYLSGGDEVFGPDYGAATVYTVTAPDYATRCPNAAKLISNMRFDTDMESEIMVGVLNKKDPVMLAKEWIKKNPAWLEKWLGGVTTFDGKDAMSASRAYFGI